MDKFYKTSESVDSNYFVLYGKKVGASSMQHYEAYLDPDFEKGLTTLELAKICQSAKVLFILEALSGDPGNFDESFYTPYCYQGTVDSHDNEIPMAIPHVILRDPSGGSLIEKAVYASVYND